MSTSKNEKAQGARRKAQGSASPTKSARPEAITVADVLAEKAKGEGRKVHGSATPAGEGRKAKGPAASAGFWAAYTGHRAAVRVERVEAAIAAGAASYETEDECQARIARMKSAAHADFALSDKLHAMVALPEPSNDDSNRADG